MTSKLKILRYVSVLLFTGLFCSILIYPFLKGKSAAYTFEEVQKELELVKPKIEKPNSSPKLTAKYNRLMERIVGECGPFNQIIQKPRLDDLLAPAASLCINGSLAVADPDFNRPLASSTGTGIGNGTVGNCSLSGTATAANYDAYNFDLTGCAAFPTEITATLCGPIGCQHLGNVDTMLLLYRNVSAGDPLTANGGLPGVFNPTSSCTNARGASDDLGTTSGTPNNPGGATCNQVVTANCVAPCTSPTNAGGLSGFRRQLGNGRFTLVVAGFSNATTGSYNLYVNAPAAGCAVTLAPTAAAVTLSGRVLTSSRRGIKNAVVTLSGGDLSESISQRTNPFGYYNFNNISAGGTYVLTVSSKNYTFADTSKVISLNENISDANFISIQ